MENGITRKIHLLAVDADGPGEVGLGLVGHGVLDEVEEAVRGGGDVAGVVALPAGVHEVVQVHLLLNLEGN